MKTVKISFLLIISILMILGFPTIGVAQIPRPEAIYPFGHYDTAGDANAVHVSGNVAYVVDSSDGLLSINIQDPSNPTLLDKISTTGYPKDIFILGNIAYVATNLGLELFDVTNPKNLIRLDSYALLTGEGENILVDGHIAFLVAQTAGIKVIDVSDPKNLTEISTINTIGDAYGVEIQGDILFAASWDYGIRIYNISDLTNPQLISQNPTTSRFSAVKAHGDDLFICSRDTPDKTESGLIVWDVENLKNPLVSDSEITADYAYAVDLWGDFAFVAAGTAGIYMINTTDCLNIFKLFNYNSSGTSKDLMVQGDYLYVADGNNGLLCILISLPFDPDENYDKIGYLSVNGLILDIDIQGDYLYLASYGYGLEVFKIVNPRSISIVSQLSGIGSPTSIDVEGNIAYVASSPEGLYVIDITAPYSPKKIANLTGPSDLTRIRVSGNVAYLTDRSSGLIAVNITNPFNPSILDSISLSNAEDLEIRNNLAYVVCYSSGLHVVNISNPCSMNEINSHNFYGNEFRIEIDGNIAYVATHASSGGVLAINITDPNNLDRIGLAELGSNVEGLAISGDTLIAVERFNGLYVLNVKDPYVSGGLQVGKFTALNQGQEVVVDGKLAYVSEDAGARINAILFRRSDIDDPDYDDLNFIDEVWHIGTDPLKADSDHDGINDGQEIANGTDPLDPNDPPKQIAIPGFNVWIILLISIIFLSILMRKLNFKKLF